MQNTLVFIVDIGQAVALVLVEQLTLHTGRRELAPNLAADSEPQFAVVATVSLKTMSRDSLKRHQDLGHTLYADRILGRFSAGLRLELENLDTEIRVLVANEPCVLVIECRRLIFTDVVILALLSADIP